MWGQMFFGDKQLMSGDCFSAYKWKERIADIILLGWRFQISRYSLDFIKKFFFLNKRDDNK